MSTEDNKAIARRVYEEGFNAHNPAIVDEMFAADIVQHVPSPPPGFRGDREGVKQGFAMILSAFPDWHVTVEDMLAEGDKVVTRFTRQGTQRGELLGIPATGKSVTTTGIDIFRIADGKLAEHWVESDVLGVMQQLGVIPAPGQAPS